MTRGRFNLCIILISLFSTKSHAEPIRACAMIEDFAAVLEGNSKNKAEDIAPALIAHAQEKYGARCMPASDTGTTICAPADNSQKMQFIARDQTKRMSNGIALAAIDIKVLEGAVDVRACLISFQRMEWRKNEVNENACVPSIWKKSAKSETVMFIDPRPAPSCDGLTNSISIVLAKGNQPIPYPR